MAARKVALDHYRDRRRLAQAVVVEARRLWREVDPARIRESWLPLVSRLVVVVAGAQLAAARQAERYLDEVLVEQGIDPTPEGALVASAFAGIASDGRPLDTLLVQPAITSLVALDEGRSTREALAAGEATLEMMVHTQATDAGRVADGVALTARPQVEGYVRMVVGVTCSRCIILAGRFYRWNSGFQRHPRCDCVHIPASEDTADDIRTNPRKLFESMTTEEQDRVFTKAGAQAIRDGADISRVVNVRRGMSTAAGRTGRRRLVRDERGLFTTTEATTRRGRLPGQTAGPRLMPESIYEIAKGNRDEAIRLLRLHGYIV